MADILQRPAKPAGKKAVTELISFVLTQYGLTLDPQTDCDLIDFPTRYTNKQGLFEVYSTPSGKVIGTFGLYPLSDTVCQLRKMYLLPEARGRGLGKKALTYLLEKARTQGFHQVLLETNHSLIAAISLYTSFGFQAVESEQLSPRCDQAYQLLLKEVSHAAH